MGRNFRSDYENINSKENLALLNTSMNCPHPQPFSLGRRELEFLFPLPKSEGEGEGEFCNS